MINDVMDNGITVDQCVGEGQDIAVTPLLAWAPVI